MWSSFVKMASRWWVDRSAAPNVGVMSFARSADATIALHVGGRAVSCGSAEQIAQRLTGLRHVTVCRHVLVVS